MPLKIVQQTTDPVPQHLQAAGRALWQSIMAQYQLDDAGGLAMLAQACAATDRAESCRAQIALDGELIRTKTGPRDHPLLRHELGARAFAVRTLAKLGLDLEPVRAGPGRPPGSRR